MHGWEVRSPFKTGRTGKGAAGPLSAKAQNRSLVYIGPFPPSNEAVNRLPHGDRDRIQA